MTEDLKGACSKWVLAFVWMYQQRELPVLSLCFLLSGIERKSQLLKGVQLKGPQDAIHLIISINLLHLLEELLHTEMASVCLLPGEVTFGQSMQEPNKAIE